MTWKCHLAIFKAKSPIHIGYKQIGNLKTTRYYITGRAMWGTITANLTRALFSNPKPEDYQTIGNFVKEHIRTMYFYPAIKKNEVKNPQEWSEYEVDDHLVFLPEYTENGIKFGSVSKEEFEQMFIGSFVSTALEAQTKTAEEGSLHEFEFIRNKVTTDKSTADVYWLGYIFANANARDILDNTGKKLADVDYKDVDISFTNDEKTVLFSNVLNTLFVGGERNYGLGRLKLVSLVSNPENQRLFGKFEVELNGDKPMLKMDTALAHVNLDDVKLERGFLGEIEPVVGLEWSEKGAGQKVSDALICAVPGSKVPSGKYVVDKLGIIRF